jgi:GT2 family glycosyltransferase
MVADLALSASALIAETRTAGRAANPKVAVVISTYGHAKWLAAAADGVLGQDLAEELQLVVVDDASPDNTPDVMGGILDNLSRQSYAAPRSVTYVRLAGNHGPAVGRNVGIDHAQGEFIAFTDSDCVPTAAWLREALAAFSPRVGIVQGRTRASETRIPLFEHHIDTASLDGTFATANVVYRREALATARFDLRCWSRSWTMEDTELAWHVLEAGWEARFAERALVLHRVIPLSARQWLAWPTRLRVFPALVARHPAMRRHLLLGVWMRPLHLWFDLALVGALAALWWPPALLLVIPYVIAFLRSRSLRGRFPPAKAAAHVAWDAVSFATLVAFSLRHRAPVL